MSCSPLSDDTTHTLQLEVRVKVQNPFSHCKNFCVVLCISVAERFFVDHHEAFQEPHYKSDREVPVPVLLYDRGLCDKHMEYFQTDLHMKHIYHKNGEEEAPIIHQRYHMPSCDTFSLPLL